MGDILVKPDFHIKDIVVDVDPKSGVPALIINEWGKSSPVIELNGRLIDPGSIKKFTLTNSINSFPVFSIGIDDEQGLIRESLKNEIDTCIIFIGYKNFYFKFLGLITSIDSRVGRSNITVSGNWHNPNLYLSKQQIWNDKSVKDVLTDICTETKLGLYCIDNDMLNEIHDTIINPGLNQIDFINYLVQTYTYNIWSIDTHGFLHIGDILKIKQEPISKFTLSSNGKIVPETDILFTNQEFEKPEEGEKVLRFDKYSHSSDYAFKFYQSNQTYKVRCLIDDSGADEVEDIRLNDTELWGIGLSQNNTFAGFVNHKKPFYGDITTKLLNGNISVIELSYMMFELNVFDMVETQFITYQTLTKEQSLDKHSGTRMVTGYTFNFTPGGNIGGIMGNTDLQPTITQRINLL